MRTSIGTAAPFPSHGSIVHRRHGNWVQPILRTLAVPFFAHIRPRPQIILKFVFGAFLVVGHDHELAVINVSKVLKALHAPMIPLHQKNTSHEAVCDEDTYTRAVILAKQPPKRLIEATHSVICICSRFAVRNTVEEVAVVRSLHPHSFHLFRTRLEIPKILLS